MLKLCGKHLNFLMVAMFNGLYILTSTPQLYSAEDYSSDFNTDQNDRDLIILSHKLHNSPEADDFFEADNFPLQDLPLNDIHEITEECLWTDKKEDKEIARRAQLTLLLKTARNGGVNYTQLKEPCDEDSSASLNSEENWVSAAIAPEPLHANENGMQRAIELDDLYASSLVRIDVSSDSGYESGTDGSQLVSQQSSYNDLSNISDFQIMYQKKLGQGAVVSFKNRNFAQSSESYEQENDMVKDEIVPVTTTGDNPDDCEIHQL